MELLIIGIHEDNVSAAFHASRAACVTMSLFLVLHDVYMYVESAPFQWIDFVSPTGAAAAATEEEEKNADASIVLI